MAEILAQDTGEDWECEFDCERCDASVLASAQDLEADSFKVRGYHFDGTAVNERKLYIICPACGRENFLPDDMIETVPYLLNQAAELHYTERRKREDDAMRSMSE